MRYWDYQKFLDTIEEWGKGKTPHYALSHPMRGFLSADVVLCVG
jgi:hypothetical protein